MAKLTAQEILMEYCKCMANPTYAIENYLKTHDVMSKRYVPFVLFEKQKELVWSYETFSETIATKSRQAGVTTTTAAYFAVKMMLASKDNPEKMVIVTNKLEGSKKILAQVVEFMMQLAEHSFFFIDQENPSINTKPPRKIFSVKSKTEVVLSHNGSSVKAISSGLDATRGLTATWLLFDEAAFIENGIDIYTSALPLISTGGKCTMISTANGRDPLYHSIYEGVLKGTNTFNLVELRWYMDPRFNKDLQWVKGEEVIDETEFNVTSYKKMVNDGYKATSTWYRNMCAKQNGNLRAIAQEIDVDFLNSGGNVVSADAQKIQREVNMIKDPAFQDLDHKDMWVWKSPEEVKGCRTIMAIDPATGSGADFSSIQILNVDYIDENGNPGVEQIAEYYGKIKPDLLGYIGLKYAELYESFVIVDCIGGYGFPTMEVFINNKYKHIYYDTLSNVSSLLTAKNRMQNLTSNGKPAGFHNGALRPIIGNKLEAYIENNILKMRSSRAIHELETWIWNGEKRDHTRSAHDDALMALGLGIFVFESAFKALKISTSAMQANLAAFTPTTYNGNNTKPMGGTIVSNQQATVKAPVAIFGGSYGSANFRADRPASRFGTSSSDNLSWLFKV